MYGAVSFLEILTHDIGKGLRALSFQDGSVALNLPHIGVFIMPLWICSGGYLEAPYRSNLEQLNGMEFWL